MATEEPGPKRRFDVRYWSKWLAEVAVITCLAFIMAWGIRYRYEPTGWYSMPLHVRAAFNGFILSFMDLMRIRWRRRGDRTQPVFVSFLWFVAFSVQQAYEQHRDARAR